MALQGTNNTALYWPGMATKVTSNPFVTGTTIIDASGEYDAFIFQAKQDMTISHVFSRLSSVSGSATADVRIETVDPATGLPTGTLWATNTNGITATLSSNLETVTALTASASITRSQIFAVKFLYNAATSFQVSKFSGMENNFTSWGAANTGTPALNVNTGVAIGLGSSSTNFYQLDNVWPITNFTGTASFNNTSGGRRGIKFQVPFPCKVSGLVFIMPTSSAGDFNIGIWDASNAEVGSSITAFDRSALNYTNLGRLFLPFDNAATIAANTNYYAAMEPTSSTNCTIQHITLSNAAYRSGLPGGTNVCLSTYASGTWTDTTTSVPLIDLRIEQLDDGAGGGGGGGASFFAHPL